MKIETQALENHEMKIVAEFEAEALDKFRHQAARKISQTSKIPGFRPGKAPYDVVRRLYGIEAITQEAVELLIDAQYSAVLTEAKVEPGAPGRLEEIISTDPLKIAFIVPLAPEIHLGDYKAIRREFTPPQVSDKEIADVLRNIRADNSTAETVERPAKEGDLCYIRLSARLVNPVEGQEAEVIPERPVQVVVGENPLQPDDWPYPGFSGELIGLSAKDTKTVIHTFGEDAPSDKLMNQEVEFKFEVSSVKELTMPELTDEFVQTLGGEYTNLDELNVAIRKQLEANTSDSYTQDYFAELVDEVIACSTLLYPPQAIDEEVHEMMHRLEHDLADRGMDIPTYLKSMNVEEAEFIETQVKPSARRRLERSMVIEELVKTEEIHLNSEELEKESLENMQQVAGEVEQKKLSRARQREIANSVTLETASRMLNRLVLERLKMIATGQAETPAATEETPVVEEKPAPAKKKAKRKETKSETEG
ncbi:MAG TPA: trigger factor [Anaerolineaceae bacterium]|nr:trigger factor [Anaerolineaceae bacterium]